jgi:hypothetical protein
MNELKQKASKFYGEQIWLREDPVNVYLNHRHDLFTIDKGDILIGTYNKHTEGADFFVDVIRRLREYTKDYAIRTSLQNVAMEDE